MGREGFEPSRLSTPEDSQVNPFSREDQDRHTVYPNKNTLVKSKMMLMMLMMLMVLLLL
jgi:hypothetical protein